jgi:hypothetical protein
MLDVFGQGWGLPVLMSPGLPDSRAARALVLAKLDQAKEVL